MVNAMTDKTKDNPYLRMPLNQVKADAIHGVSLARMAWRQRDPKEAAKALGFVTEPQQHETMNTKIDNEVEL